jgi:plasmid stabilization system protein ParE
MQADARGLPAFLTELAAAIAQLERFPLSGPLWRESRSVTRRSLIVGPYRLIYAVSEEAVHLGLLQHVRRGPGTADLTLLP